MFWLKPEVVRHYDVKDAEDFVNFWSLQTCGFAPVIIDDDTREATDEQIDFVRELNVGKQLTEQNVKRLLRWRDSGYTYIIRVGSDAGQINYKAHKIVQHVDVLNKFRGEKLSESQFKTATGKMITSGYSMRLFLFNICRPHEYPLAHPHAFRAFSCHKGIEVGGGFDFKRGWAAYAKYREYFFELAGACDINPKSSDSLNYVKDLARIYNALTAFGNFLREYGENDKHYFEVCRYDE